MNKVFNLSVIIVFFASLSFAQNSVSSEYSEEELDTTSFKYKYDYLVRAQEEKLQLIKIDLWSKAFNRLEFGYERKVVSNFSMLVKVGTRGLGLFSWNRQDVSDIRDDLQAFYVIAPRYYYNLNKRIDEGKSANNFSADYISVQGEHSFHVNNSNYKAIFSVLYGIQRRIGKYAYMDINFGPGYFVRPSGEQVGLETNIDFGLAF